MLKITPLGGLGEIGLNMMVFEYKDHVFIVDSGIMFPEDHMLGVDVVIPNMDYLQSRVGQILGIIYTHAHEDHIGALPYFLRRFNVPIFGTPFTLGMVRHKLEDHDLLTAAKLYEVRAGERLKLGPFVLDLIRVGHSVVDGIGLAIHTPVGTVVHTGDFKLSHTADPKLDTDVNRFAKLGASGVLALMSDSTNVEREGYNLSDQEIGDTLARITRGSDGRVIVALFASNIARIQQVVDIARQLGRRVLFNGRSIEASVRIAKRLGYLRISEEMQLDPDEIDYLPDDRVMIITTGSQGESMASLARMAAGTHRQISIKSRDTVILSSKIIPGNEKSIAGLINKLYKLGANVIYEKISAIHVSGHAFRDELKLMLNMIRPKYFVPIHGEYRHLVLHGALARESGMEEEDVFVIENGQTLQFDEKGARVGTKIRTGRVMVDGKGIGDVGWSVLKERRNLSEDGVVAVTMAFDEDTGVIIFGPEIVSKGFVFETETGHLLQDAQCVVLEVVEEYDIDTPQRVEKIRHGIQSALRKYFYFTIQRRPVIFPFILEV